MNINLQLGAACICIKSCVMELPTPHMKKYTVKVKQLELDTKSNTYMANIKCLNGCSTLPA